MAKSTTFVGIDAHKKSLYVTICHPESKKEQFQILNTEKAVKKLTKKLNQHTPVSVCYEAGPCGYVLQRALVKQGVPCAVIAPSLIPKKPGERIKTDQRDSKKLAELFSAGLLTEVHPPTPEEESVRELCRAREDAKDDQKRAKNRIGKFLLRKGKFYTAGKKAWTKVYVHWLQKLVFEHAADQMTYEHYLITLNQASERLEEIGEKLEEVSKTEPYREPIAYLCCLHGIKTVSAMTIFTELHGFCRFSSPRRLMSFLGLTPSEFSSGGKRQRGSITKTGNSHVRRILVEAAWNHRKRPINSKGVRARRKGQPGWVLAIAQKSQKRLFKRYWKLQMAGKNSKKTAVAVAREMVGFIWSILIDPRVSASGIN